MKIKLFATLCFLFLCIFSFAQNKEYFAGKWDVMVYETPKGNQQMIIQLNRINGKLQGAIVGPTDDVKKLTKIEETANSVTLTFKYLLFNVHLMLQKKDENNVTGKLQDDYKAIGKRMK